VLEYILTHEGCDVDPINRIDRATPLHLAVGLEDPELRAEIVESLLEAGADYRSAHPVPRPSTVVVITSLDPGYGIKTGRRHRSSSNRMTMLP
jgi:hypothetical protein